MDLDAILESLDGTDTAIHQFYTEKDGKFYLNVSDTIKVHPKVANLQSAFERVKADKKKLADELRAATDKLASVPDDFDADEWISLKANSGDPDDPEGKKKKPNDEHLQSQKRLYEQRLAAAEKKHAEDLAKLQETLGKKDRTISKLLVEDGLSSALTKAGIDPKYMKAAKALLKDSVKVVAEDDTFRAVVETDMGEDDVSKFVENWAQSDEGKAFVKPATPDNAPGSKATRSGEANPFHKDNWNKTAQGQLKRTNPASAERLAKAAGFASLDAALGTLRPVA